MAGIFISYRNIARSYAPMLIDRELSRRFGPEHVFEAGRSNPPATAFNRAIEEWLDRTTVMVVLIDSSWIGEDLHLLFDKTDWVRREILHAITHGTEILPVLLDGVDMPPSSSVPPELAPLTKCIALHMQSRTAIADLQRLLGEVERLAPELVLATLMDVDPPAPTNPASLLRAEQGVFPLRDRPELAELRAWWDDPSAAPVRLVTGPAGAGKTRLALALCASVRGTGSPAGILSPSAPVAALDRLDDLATRCLVVIDGAEARPAQVTAALGALRATPAAPGRLLLLARSAGDWLGALREDPDDEVAALVAGIVPTDLEPLSTQDGDFTLACAAFADRLGRAVPPLPDPLPGSGTLLELQATALSHVFAGDIPDGSSLSRIMHLERDYWLQTAAALGLVGLGRREINEVMGVVTLFGAATESEANALLARLRAIAGGSVRAVDACRDLLRTMVPGPAPLNPLQPAQLGEDAVAELLAGNYPFDDLLPVVADEQLTRAMVVLGQTLERHPTVQGPLVRLFTRAPARLMPRAMTTVAALVRPEPFVAALVEALPEVPANDLDRIVAALPERSAVLAPFAMAATRRALAVRPTGGPPTIEAATFRRRLAWRLLDVGEPRAALDAARAAVDELGVILVAAAGPAAQDARAEFAAALAVLALALDQDPAAAAAARAAGAEAVACYRALPDDDNQRRDLARVLHNQSVRLSRDGDLEPALAAATEAYALTRVLDSERPARNRSLHADVIDNLAAVLAAHGPLEDAERFSRMAVDLRRQLAAARPDAFRPHLAGTLFNLGRIILAREPGSANVRPLWTEALTICRSLSPSPATDALAGRIRERLEKLAESTDD